MFRPVRLALLALSAACASNAALAQPICTGDLYRKWRFHAGAPLSHSPAVSSHGEVAVATHEGYLHALHASGAFSWSYTVEGTLLTGVFVDAADHFVAASSAPKVYSLAEDGTPHWVFTAPRKPDHSVVDPTRGIFFLTRGRGLYALSSKAGLIWSMPLGGNVISPLRMDEEGAVWILTDGGTLHRIRTPYFSAQWPLPDKDRPQLLDAAGGVALILDGSTLDVVERGGKSRWQRQNVVHAALTRGGKEPQVVVLYGNGELQWLTLKSGKRVRRVHADGVRPSAISASQSLVFVGGADGRLTVLSTEGIVGQCRVSEAALLQPVYDEARGQVLVAGGDGELAAIGFGSGR